MISMADEPQETQGDEARLGSLGRSCRNGGCGTGKAANFSDEHVDRETFDRDVRSGDNWVREGASLLRAARAVMRQVYLDYLQRMEDPGDERRPGSRSDIVNQAIFLAALAVENGLKAVIAEGMPGALPIPPSGALPNELRGHDLVDLASTGRAGMAPVDEHEKEALKRGQSYIEWLGRYPATAAHDEHHTRAAVNVNAIFSAYERVFSRCVQQAERRRCSRVVGLQSAVDAGAAAYGALFEWSAEGVDPLPEGSIVPQIEFVTYPGYVTWSFTG
jgi:hypothetical protein